MIPETENGKTEKIYPAKAQRSPFSAVNIRVRSPQRKENTEITQRLFKYNFNGLISDHLTECILNTS